MKKTYINIVVLLITSIIIQSCSLNRDPLDSYSDVTEGETDAGNKVVFKDRESVDNYLASIYLQLKDRQEHWLLDTFGKAEGEGLKFVVGEAKYLLKNGKWYMLPVAFMHNVVKFLGYKAGYYRGLLWMN